MENYKILGLVGLGDYGMVEKCVDKRSGKVVAVKKHFDVDEMSVLTALKREYQMQREMQHSHVVKVLDHFQENGYLYGVFEIADHTVFDDLKLSSWGLSRRILRKYIFQLLLGMNYIHNINIIHLDLKLDNFLVTHSGVLKVADLGLAEEVLPDHPCSVRCAEGLNAPELLLDDTKYGKAADVWSIGINILCMANGEYFISSKSDNQQLEEIVRKVGPLTVAQQLRYCDRYGGRALLLLPPTQTHESLQEKYGLRDPLLAHLVDRCLQVDPCNRATCAELLEHSYFTRDGFNIKFTKRLQKMIKRDIAHNNLLVIKCKTPPTTHIGRWIEELRNLIKEAKNYVKAAFMRAFKAIRHCFAHSPKVNPEVPFQPTSIAHEEQPCVEPPTVVDVHPAVVVNVQPTVGEVVEVDSSKVVQSITAHVQKIQAEVELLNNVAEGPSAAAGRLRAVLKDLTSVMKDLSTFTVKCDPAVVKDHYASAAL